MEQNRLIESCNPSVNLTRVRRQRNFLLLVLLCAIYKPVKFARMSRLCIRIEHR